jgi:hypothetical protein
MSLKSSYQRSRASRFRSSREASMERTTPDLIATTQI